MARSTRPSVSLLCRFPSSTSETVAELSPPSSASFYCPSASSAVYSPWPTSPTPRPPKRMAAVDAAIRPLEALRPHLLPHHDPRCPRVQILLRLLPLPFQQSLPPPPLLCRRGFAGASEALVCHDFKGGYQDDLWVQVGPTLTPMPSGTRILWTYSSTSPTTSSRCRRRAGPTPPTPMA